MGDKQTVTGRLQVLREDPTGAFYRIVDGVWVDFAPDVVWIYKSLVRPSHRGRGLAPALYGLAHGLGSERGRRRSIICVESHNAPSIAAVARAGHAAAGSAAYLVRKGVVSAWYSPEAQRRALRLYIPERSHQ